MDLDELCITQHITSAFFVAEYFIKLLFHKNLQIGGEGGIRTPGRVTPTTDFESVLIWGNNISYVIVY